MNDHKENSIQLDHYLLVIKQHNDDVEFRISSVRDSFIADFATLKMTKEDLIRMSEFITKTLGKKQ